MPRPKLIRVSCAKCGRHLADTLPGATVFCPKCGVWTAAVERDTN